MKRNSLLVLVLFFLLTPGASAYHIKLKDGAILSARVRYEVKGTKAIIRLRNGTVTQIDLDQIDIPGTEQYNRENPGDYIPISRPVDGFPNATPTPVPTRSLPQRLPPRKRIPGDWPGSASRDVEPLVDSAFRRVLDRAGIARYRLTNDQGKLRLQAIANTEKTVFHTLSAAARALADLGSRGMEITVEIVLTTSSGDSGGSFEMTSEQGRQLVNGNIAVADYFIRNVIL